MPTSHHAYSLWPLPWIRAELKAGWNVKLLCNSAKETYNIDKSSLGTDWFTLASVEPRRHRLVKTFASVVQSKQQIACNSSVAGLAMYDFVYEIHPAE